MRDEIGAHHVRGAVGISTRGRDTGDLQLFIDHVDVPRLDHEYTVFARVVAGMQSCRPDAGGRADEHRHGQVARRRGTTGTGYAGTTGTKPRVYAVSAIFFSRRS